MSLSDSSSELAPSLAELTALTGAATTVNTTDRAALEAIPSSDTNFAVATTTERTVYSATKLGTTNSSNQAPTIRHDKDDVDTPYQQGKVTLRSSEANSNSHQQTRPNSNAQRDDDDGGVDVRRRIDSPPQRFLRARGYDSYDNQNEQGRPLEGDDAGDYLPTPNHQSGSEDGGDDILYDGRHRGDNNQRQDDYRRYNDDDRNNNDYQRSNNDNRQYHDDNRPNYDVPNPPRDNRNAGTSYGTE